MALSLTRTTLLLLLICAPAWAMPGAGGAPGQANAPSFSMPLPSAELPLGVVTVKVVGQGMDDLKVGQRVVLQEISGDAPGVERSAQTGADGRARFDGLTRGKQYRLAVELDGQTFRSTPFAGPESGGLRLLFSVNSGGKSAHPAMSTGAGPVGAASAPGAAMPPPGAAMPPPGAAMPPPGMGGPRPQNPHQGMGNPHQGMGNPHQGMGNPHQKSPHGDDPGAAQVEPAPELKVGEVLVLVGKGLNKAPLPDLELRFADQSEARWRTDQEGKVLIRPESKEGRVGPLEVRFQGMTYRSGGLQLPTEGGLKVTFNVFEKTSKPDKVTLGRGSHLVCQVGEGGINVMQVLELVNEGEAIFDPGPAGFLINLPPTAHRVEVPAELREMLASDAHSPRLRLLSPLTPGRSVLRVFYELRYEGAELDVQQTMTLPAAESVLMVVNNEQINLLGPSVQRERDFAPDQRQERIFGLAPVKRGATLEFTLTNLPHRDPRLIQVAVVAAGIIALWALLAAWAGPRRAAQQLATREALLDQLVQLDRAGSKSKQEQARREELLRALRREWNA